MDYGYLILSEERRGLCLILTFLHLIKYPWAQRLAYYTIARKITEVDASTGTITVDSPFPRSVKSGSRIVHRYPKGMTDA